MTGRPSTASPAALCRATPATSWATAARRWRRSWTRSACAGVYRPHAVEIAQGTFKVGDMVQAAVNVERRKAIRANHWRRTCRTRRSSWCWASTKQAGSVVALTSCASDSLVLRADDDRGDGEGRGPGQRLILRQREGRRRASRRALEDEEARRGGDVRRSTARRCASSPCTPESTELCGGTHGAAQRDIGPSGDEREWRRVRRAPHHRSRRAPSSCASREHALRKVAELFEDCPG